MQDNTALLFSTKLNYVALDKTSVTEAKEIFEEYQSAGIIKTESAFDDAVWYTTDEYSNIGLHFSFNKFTYRRFYEEKLEIPFEDFIEYVKAFLISLLGKNALNSLRTVLLDLRHITEESMDKIYGFSDFVTITMPVLCSEFFSSLPNADENEDITRLADAMDSYAEVNISKNSSQRSLADFETYFLFDDILRDFWQGATVGEKLFYYPLYLWWVLTAVLPLRPREFLLTERNCMSLHDDGFYYLRLRRNKLKGGNRGISYKVNEDYFTTTYKIPDHLAQKFNDYFELTDEYEDTDLNTLFVTDTHYRKWGQAKHSNSRYFTYNNLRTLLRYFYREIIQQRYGYTPVSNEDGNHLNDGEISYIHLGDTRHIALINIIREGGTPATAMYLAAHTNEDMAANYYSNLKTLVECSTYRQYRKLTAGKPQYETSQYTAPLLPGDGIKMQDGSYCYSRKYEAGDFSDCLASSGGSGELGHCPSCKYNRKNGFSYFSDDDIYCRNLKDDCKALSSAVEKARKNKGLVSDIGEAMLKLQSSALSYEQFLKEKKYGKNSDH